MRVIVNWDLCESNALCEAAAPNVFTVGDDDQLTVHEDEVDSTELSALESAVSSCPKQALRLTE
ncbi:ferredoxin [Mycobacterium sp. CVI_P3]|uniref:Ferredoxin n=1 Tax=Mycobacterium pinniadriaticum TaxID=2994102 RepID=A0ABT3SH11_9MYCO|nr:ferredoxin [Mycobacterium pinniadriaticum]MCX2931740.1 ferredoxin [Mycobacterium pinniadriaticum]MCX2938185.1 ferredoxin [Mycobacterium pinniadriaticum]